MKLQTLILISLMLSMAFTSYAQDYETCSFSEDAWAGDTAAITAFLISCGRIDTTNYDDKGNKTTGKPSYQKITMKLNSGKVIHNDSIYFISEKMPVYPGGDEALRTDIVTQLKYPEAARKHETEGNVVVSFIVNRDGKIGNVKILRCIGNGCEEEALRVVKSLKTWTP